MFTKLLQVAACISYRRHARRIHHDGACTGMTLDALWVNTRTASPYHHPVPPLQPPLLVVARLLSPSEPPVASPEHSICGPMPVPGGLSEENQGGTSFSSLPPCSFYSWVVMELEEWLEEKRICMFSHYIGKERWLSKVGYKELFRSDSQGRYAFLESCNEVFLPIGLFFKLLRFF